MNSIIIHLAYFFEKHYLLSSLILICRVLQTAMFPELSDVCLYVYINRNHNLEISTAPNKAKSREPAYPQTLSQNIIYKMWVG